MRRRKEVVAHVVRGSGGPLRPGINRVRVVGVLFEKGRPIVIVKDAAPPAPKPRRTHEQKVADQLAAQDPYCLTKAGCEQTRTRLLAFAKHLRQLAEALKNPLTRHGTLERARLEPDAAVGILFLLRDAETIGRVCARASCEQKGA